MILIYLVLFKYFQTLIIWVILTLMIWYLTFITSPLISCFSVLLCLVSLLGLSTLNFDLLMSIWISSLREQQHYLPCPRFSWGVDSLISQLHGCLLFEPESLHLSIACLTASSLLYLFATIVEIHNC